MFEKVTDMILETVKFIEAKNLQDKVEKHLTEIAETVVLSKLMQDAGTIHGLAFSAETVAAICMYMRGYKDALRKDMVFVVAKPEENDESGR